MGLLQVASPSDVSRHWKNDFATIGRSPAESQRYVVQVSTAIGAPRWSRMVAAHEATHRHLLVEPDVEQWDNIERDNRVLSTFHRLVELSDLAYDWDSYGAEPIETDAILEAVNLLVFLLNRSASGANVLPYHIGPLPDGGIEFVWRGASQTLEVDISPSGTLGYLLIINLPSGRQLYIEDNDISRTKVLTHLDETVTE